MLRTLKGQVAVSLWSARGVSRDLLWGYSRCDHYSIQSLFVLQADILRSWKGFSQEPADVLRKMAGDNYGIKWSMKPFLDDLSCCLKQWNNGTQLVDLTNCNYSLIKHD